ncbi:putative acetyltransferase, GNAT [Cellulomonas chitinilytica]|uniref:Acetyltransferase, GNAT n=1 Tax=Cellulomonas chitinilytica TaxID=398759 RepID=A0A919TYF0_9CELL|nr:GNAT family N-acetyltransferase [Cellulomonas chitinilytica]GIG20525.1 putative acetyltransferase, GNAT [Cellulomonas chitinilytica]
MTDTSLSPLADRADAPAAPPRPPDGLGLTWRPLRRDDAEALTRLLNAVEEADGAPYRTAVPEAQERFDGDWHDPTTDTITGVDADGVLRAYAQVTALPGDVRTIRAFLDGGVDPQWRGRGVGRAVLAWSEGRGRQLLARSTAAVPGRLAVHIQESATATARLLTAAGFRPVRYYDDMRRSLAEPLPLADPPAGIRLVPWSADLEEQVRLAHNEAFADHWGSEPRNAEQWAQHRSMFAPMWSTVAVDEATGEVAGYLMSGRYEQDWAVNGFSFGYVELLGVRPGWRRRGLAPSLLVAAMTAYRADGMQYAVLGVDSANQSGAHGLYERLGFEAQHREIMYSIEL